MDYGLFTFSSTYGAILAEKLLRPVANVQVVPVLREISTGCGIAVRFLPKDLDALRAALEASPLKPEEYACYGVTTGGASLQITPLPCSKRGATFH